MAKTKRRFDRTHDDLRRSIEDYWKHFAPEDAPNFALYPDPWEPENDADRRDLHNT